jgi:glycosyltransferase involved in cell wall biosynthesis
MKIAYFYRNPQCGFSIQRVFQTLTKEIEKYIEIEELFLPFSSAGIFDIFHNGRFAKKSLRHSHIIHHITGDVHYLTYFLPKKSTIVTVHDIMYYAYSSSWKKQIWKRLYIDSLKKAAHVVFISEFAKKQVMDLVNLPHERIRVIPNAVSSDYQYVPKPFEKSNPVILHIGTSERKNLHRSISALKGIPCHLRIIGLLSNDIKQLLHENKIDYSNAFHLTNEQIVKEYEQCDIVNFPSIFEGFGMPVVEGQAVGRAVVTSNISPMKEVAGDGAFLVDPFNVNSIREGYIKLIRNDSLREEIIEKGRQNILRFQVDNIARQYINLYNEILS